MICHFQRAETEAEENPAVMELSPCQKELVIVSLSSLLIGYRTGQRQGKEEEDDKVSCRSGQ